MRILARLFKHKPPKGCEWEDSCDCHGNKARNTCEQCKWYWVIDSGYGYCRALPKHTSVAWCKDVCSLYKERPDHSD